MSIDDRLDEADPWTLDTPGWSHTDDRPVPITVSVEPTCSNAYGPPIYLHLEQDNRTMGVWLDLDTWEALYQAGIDAHTVRTEATERGWT